MSEDPGSYPFPFILLALDEVCVKNLSFEPHYEKKKYFQRCAPSEDPQMNEIKLWTDWNINLRLPLTDDLDIPLTDEKASNRLSLS